MAFSNARVLVRVGNVESRLRGHAPREALDRALNPHFGRAARTDDPFAPPKTARVYDMARDTFLTGALARVKRVLRREGVRFWVRDERRQASRIGPFELSGPPLRDYQRDVVEKALVRGHGLIDIGTGGGKTLLAAAIIARLSLPTLYLVTTRTLLSQTIRALRRFLGVEPGVIGDGLREPRNLTVALVQALDAPGVELERFAGGTLVFDEGHHAAAGSWQEHIRRISPRYHFYLSAVPFRAGGDQAVLDALAGDRLTGGAYSARFLVTRGYACPVKVRAVPIKIRGEMTEKPFADIYGEFLVGNESRNARIAGIVRKEIARGRSILVLVDRIRHGEDLAARIGPLAKFVHGSCTRRVLDQQVAAFSQHALPTLIATSGLFQEGVSIDGIEVLMMAGGLKSRAKVLQSIGRGMRLAPGKDACTYVDFFDDDEAGILRAHARQRFEVLKREGFEVPPLAKPERSGDPDEEVRPAWTPVPGTNRFLFLDGEGRVKGRGECLSSELVPAKICRRCRTPLVCGQGGRIEWLEDQDS